MTSLMIKILEILILLLWVGVDFEDDLENYDRWADSDLYGDGDLYEVEDDDDAYDDQNDDGEEEGEW